MASYIFWYKGVDLSLEKAYSNFFNLMGTERSKRKYNKNYKLKIMQE